MSLPPCCILFALCLFGNLSNTHCQQLIGNWQGIDMYQDENTYDGKVFYLPNKESLVITAEKFKIYFYPYYKSDEFDFVANAKSIVYNIDRKKVKSDYHFQGDTLVLSMHFINKTFIKMYKPIEMKPEVIDDLDAFGFHPNALKNEYEIDTLHPELQRGYNNINQLNFTLLKYMQFINNEEIKIDRKHLIKLSRGYHTFQINLANKTEEFKILNINGTQQFMLMPISQCNCDSISIPYITVSWADRIRKKIIEDASCNVSHNWEK